MNNSKIEWTDSTWNPIRGCSVVSEGCRNCYAMAVAARFSGEGQAYEGLAYRNSSGAHWTGQVRLIEEHLEDPLRWKRPRRIFVNSMSDLFHPEVSFDDIDRIFAVMALAPQHIFQVLTKRPERMLEYLSESRLFPDEFSMKLCDETRLFIDIPLPNVWLGVSVEDQKTANERIPLLLQTPAAVRWISAEPLLGAINLTNVFPDPTASLNAFTGEAKHLLGMRERTLGKIDWVVVGGESGTSARPFNLEWARSIIKQCGGASVSVFMKQLGRYFTVNYYDHEFREEYESKGWDWPEPVDWNTRHGQPPPSSRVRIPLKDRKGGDMSEWIEDLRIREFPANQ